MNLIFLNIQSPSSIIPSLILDPNAQICSFQCNEILDQFGSKFHTTTTSPSKAHHPSSPPLFWIQMHRFAAFQCNEILDQFGSKFHTTMDSPSKHSFVLVEKRDGMILKYAQRQS
jgi:hypothetical protein